MGGGGSKTETTSNKVDPQMMALYQQNYATASDVANAPFQPYTGERVAGFNSNQAMGQNALLRAAGDPTALNAITAAQGRVGGLMDYRTPSISAPPLVASTDVAPGKITWNGVSPGQVNAGQVAAGQLANTDLSPYLNPYTDAVVNSALADLQRARDVQGVSDNASAMQAHAFGGTRQAVLNANTTDNYLRNVASTTAGLRQAGYANAQQAALSDINNRLGADQFNVTTRLGADEFNVGTRLNADQFNATGQLNADQFNLTSRLGADQFNAANRLNADQFNATGIYNAGVANAGNDLASANFRLNAANQYAGLGSNYFNQSAQQGNLYSMVGAQQQALQQAQNDAAYEEFMRQLNYPYQQQQLRNQALGMMPLQQTSTTTSSSSGGGLGSVLGGVGQVALGIGGLATGNPAGLGIISTGLGTLAQR